MGGGSKSYPVFQLDACFRMAFSGPSETFDSPLLASSECWPIGAVEAWGGAEEEEE